MAADTLSLDFGRDKPYYVYLYRDPRKGKRMQPIYVGKGKSASKKLRADVHWDWATENPFLAKVLRKIRSAGLKPVIEIVAWCDDQDDAFSLEAMFIARFGRRDLGTGPLTNLTDGGEGGRGQVCSAETRKLLSKSSAIRWRDPEYAARITECGRRRWTDADFRERRIEAIRKLASTPTFRKVMSAAQVAAYARDPDLARRRIVGMQSPDARSRAAEGRQRSMQSEVYRERKRQETLEKWQDAAHVEARVAAMRSAQQRPEEIARKRAVSSAGFEKRRAKMLAASRAALADPAKRAAWVAKIRASRRATVRSKDVSNSQGSDDSGGGGGCA